MLETLQCEAGHKWTRERKKGKKPQLCPEHKELAPVLAAERRVREAQGAPESAPEPTPAVILDDPYQEQVDAILDNERIDIELKLKLGYCQAELTGQHGRPARKNDPTLTQRRTELIAEADRLVRSVL